MTEFEPSNEFVSNVMKRVFACEAEFAESRRARSLRERLYASRPFRYLMVHCGALFGVLSLPATCL